MIVSYFHAAIQCTFCVIDQSRLYYVTKVCQSISCLVTILHVT